jgi:hypothetical protein
MVPRHKLKGEKPFLEQTKNVNLKLYAKYEQRYKLCKLYQQEEERWSLLKPAESVLRPHTKVLSCITLENKLLTHIALKKHRINNSCTWGSKHALVIRGLKLRQIQNLGG